MPVCRPYSISNVIWLSLSYSHWLIGVGRVIAGSVAGHSPTARRNQTERPQDKRRRG